MITIENYEEYFLLYVDNELPAEQRAAVERFVADNPHTGEELGAMLQCRVEPDRQESLPDKAMLLHHEEILLSYVDGELDVRERSEVEALVQRDARAAEVLRRLLQTVSQPDASIVFPDTESLYRHEKDRRIVLLPWLRAGIAAAVLAAVALLLLPHGRKETVQPAVAVKKVPAAVTPASPRTLYIDKKEEKGEQPAEKEKAVYASTKGRGSKPAVVKRGENGATGTASNIPLVAQTMTTADTGSRTAGVTRSTDMTRSGNMTIAALETNKGRTLPANTVAMVNIPKEQSSFATQALLREAQEESGTDQVALTSETGGKNKFRGIFRRVTRAFGTTAERDNEGQREVLISAFQVALK